MNLSNVYDFCSYAEKRAALRKEQAAAKEVVEVIARIEAPGSVMELKRKVDDWFALHQEALKKFG